MNRRFKCLLFGGLGALSGFMTLGRAVLAEMPTRYETQKLQASDVEMAHSFPSSVVLDGDTALIGATGSFEGDVSGAAYTFARDVSGSWAEQAKLVDSAGVLSPGFGRSVALDGDTAVIGANESAYVFTRDSTAGQWMERARLSASDGEIWDSFGAAVTIDGETVVIGAPGDDDKGDGSGAVYVFARDESDAWTEQGKLLASDGEAVRGFGQSVAIDGDNLLVGSLEREGEAASAYLFTRDASGQWTEQARLWASDGRPGGWGVTVALNGDTAIISRWWGQMWFGVVFVFTKDSTGQWRQLNLYASDRSPYWSDEFGRSIALDGDMLLVGAPGEGGDAQGKVYVFTRDGADQWKERLWLVASDRDIGMFFGRSVSFSNGTAMVGAPGSGPDYTLLGTAYSFDLGDLRGPPDPGNLITAVRDANSNGSADFAAATRIENTLSLMCRDGADGSELDGQVDLGESRLRLLATLGDVSGNGLDEIIALTIADDGKRVVRLFDCGDGALISQMPFGRWFHYPVALLALDNTGGGLAGRAVAVVQPVGGGRALAIVRDALTGQKFRTVRYGLAIGTPIGAAVVADINGNGVEEVAVFGRTDEGRAKVQIRDALTGEKLATFGFDKRFSPLLAGGIPPISGDASDELVVVGVNDAGGVRIEVKDSLTKQRLTTSWLRRIEEETPLAMGYVDHPEGPALAVLTEGIDGKYRTRIKRLTSSEAGWIVNFPPNITPHDFAVMDDTSGNRVPELLIVGENRRGIVKALARDAETGEELFRTNIP